MQNSDTSVSFYIGHIAVIDYCRVAVTWIPVSTVDEKLLKQRNIFPHTGFQESSSNRGRYNIQRSYTLDLEAHRLLLLAEDSATFPVKEERFRTVYIR